MNNELLIDFHKIDGKPTHFVIVRFGGGSSNADALLGSGPISYNYFSVGFTDEKPYRGQELKRVWSGVGAVAYIIRADGFFLLDGTEVDRQWIIKNHRRMQLQTWWLQEHLQGKLNYWGGRAAAADFRHTVFN